MKNRSSVSLWLKLPALTMMLLMSGCATIFSGLTDSHPLVVDTACAAFKPITFSSKDTPETREQIVEHDKVYLALCEKK